MCRTTLCEAHHSAQDLKVLFCLLKDLVNNTNLLFRKDGLFIEQMDPERVTITAVKLLNLKYYQPPTDTDEVAIGVSLVYLYKLIKSASNDMEMRFRVFEDDKDTLEVYLINPTLPASSTHVLIPSMILPKLRTNIPDIDYDFVAEVPIKHLRNAIRDVSTASKHVTIQASTESGNGGASITIKSEGPYGTITRTITPEEPGFFWFEQPGEAVVFRETFFAKYLERFLKTDMDKKIMIHMKAGLPLLITISMPYTGQVVHVIASME